ncbi:hypothetical protein [Embleya sp. MST-111070]|uniref:hypothetical protein n=1 Tax=Embleya sp. MST-111070 TaxID=3398231 RepID=UPI003F734209
MERSELATVPPWRRTGIRHFPHAAMVRGVWWVLRLNVFPDHPMFTLFVDGARRFDFDDSPPYWDLWAEPTVPPLPAEAVEAALAPVRDFVAYGSEVGRPCDNVFCCG